MGSFETAGRSVGRRILVIIASALVSLIVAGLALYVGFQQNSQMEFFDTETGKIDYQYSLLLFSLWFWQRLCRSHFVVLRE